MEHLLEIGTFVGDVTTTALAALHLLEAVDVVDETGTGVVIDMTVGGGVGHDRHMVGGDTGARAREEILMTISHCLAEYQRMYQMYRSL